MNIQITVANKIATVTGAPCIVCGNSDYTITFTFDSEWSSYTAKTARFSYLVDGEKKYIDVAFNGNICNAPILKNISFVVIGVYAGELHTTTPAKVSCKKSILCGDSNEDIPTQADTSLDVLLGGKLTEPSSGLAVGKTFRISSIDGNGHAVLECVDTTCRQVLIGEFTTTEDVLAVAIDYADGNLLTDFDRLMLLITFPTGGVPSDFTRPTVMMKTIYGLYSATLFSPMGGTKINITNIHTAFTFEIIRKPTADNLDVSVINTMVSNYNQYSPVVNSVVSGVARFNNIKDNYGVVKFGKGIQFSSGAGVNIPAGTKIELFGVKY